MLVFMILFFVVGFIAVWVWFEYDTHKEKIKLQERIEKKKEEERKRFDALSEEDKKRENSIKYAKLFNSLPTYCPSCHNMNLESRTDGLPADCKWILASTETVEKEKFDSATRIMGSTTIHTKKYQETTKTYKCPHCGYLYIEKH